MNNFFNYLDNKTKIIDKQLTKKEKESLWIENELDIIAGIAIDGELIFIWE